MELIDRGEKIPVRCRTGSSEKPPCWELVADVVRCRTGSSEIGIILPSVLSLCSLPHRQLRKRRPVECRQLAGSLPHRQLRNVVTGTIREAAEFAAAQAAQKNCRTSPNKPRKFAAAQAAQKQLYSGR